MTLTKASLITTTNVFQFEFVLGIIFLKIRIEILQKKEALVKL